MRVGDEIAAVLSSYGISVLHDRTLHDSPSYNGAYARSLTSIEGYLEKYPSLSFVLDVHRDAVQDASGQQYKLVSREEPHAAQISLVMGSDHDRWQDNLRLAVAVEERLMQSYPTLMRPITLRNYSYNQSVCRLDARGGRRGGQLPRRGDLRRAAVRGGAGRDDHGVGSAQKRWTSQSVMRAVSPQSGCGRPR